MGEVEFFGVRHHSPTAARLVAERIGAAPPAAVLIEGPSAFNDRLDELDADHILPIMIYTWAPLDPQAPPNSAAANARRGAYYPLTDFSPEWTAFTAARRAAVPCEFIDLPWLAVAAHARSENRYAEGVEDGGARQVQAILDRFGATDLDALFDEALEIDPDLTIEDYLERIEVLGALLRRDEEDAETRDRESYMASRIEDAQARYDGTILVVCGAAHLSGLRRHSAQTGQTQVGFAPPPDDDRYGIALTPTSYAVLDALEGYNAGQPTPGFYDALWHDRLVGRGDTAERVLQSVLSHLRNANQMVSTADVIAALTTARGLAQLRGHHQTWRTDLLDGLQATLVKDDDGANHPLLVGARTAMRGEKIGRLAEGTPLPPLVVEVHGRLADLGIEPTTVARTLTTDLTDHLGRERSRLLHALRVIEVPFGKQITSADADGSETWQVRWSTDYEANLITSSRFGGSLHAAVGARLLAELSENPDDPAVASRVVLKAALCGLPDLMQQLRQRLDDVLATTGDFPGLADGLSVLMRLFRYDPLLGTTGRGDLGALVETSISRAIRLVERLGRLVDDAQSQRVIDAIWVVTDAVERTTLEVDRAGWDRALASVLADSATAAGVRGAALGARWLTGAVADADLNACVHAEPSLERLGDFVAGLLAVAREAVLRRAGLIRELDIVLMAADHEDFLAAVPGLRRAFSRYPPTERTRIAEIVLGEESQVLESLHEDSGDTLAVARFEAELVARADRFLGRGVIL